MRSGIHRWFLAWGGHRALGRCAWLVGAALAFPRTAGAEVFRYVDRDGFAHEINIPNGAAEERAPAAVSVSRAAEGPFAHLDAVREAAQLYSLPIELILAVMAVESGFEPRAVSSKGAMGLMQLMPATAAEMRVVDPFNPRENTLGGARYLRILVNGADGDVTLALAGYHAGAGATERYGGVPPFPETQRYVAKVLQAYHLYLEHGPAFASITAGMSGAKKEVAQTGSKSHGGDPPDKAVVRSDAPRARTATGKDRGHPRRPKKQRRSGR